MKQLLVSLLLLMQPLMAASHPWSQAAPADLVRDAVIPDTVLDEIPCHWRPTLTPIAEKLVRDCRDARSAVLSLAGKLSQATGVYYTPQRRKHNMNALEALAEKKVSCTGQSILLVCALRSVDIPARAVGILTWNHLRGNHTWVEAWFDGSWHMIEFNERDFNTPWVMENIGMLNPALALQHIKAATPTGSSTWYPPNSNLPHIPAEDVTARYRKLALNWYEKHGLPAGTQRLLIDLQPRHLSPLRVELLNEQAIAIATSQLPTLRDDMRYFTRLALPRQGKYYLRIQGSNRKVPVKATESAVQILRLAH